jgi:hypothetical protein
LTKRHALWKEPDFGAATTAMLGTNPPIFSVKKQKLSATRQAALSP